MDSCYIPNNPQYGLQLEYTAYGGGNTVNINGSLTPYNGTSLTCHNNNTGVVIGGDPLSPCNVTTSFCTGLTPSSTGIGQLSPTTSCNDPNTLNSANGYWSTADDMGSFSLPSLDLDPLPSLFPFSPCSTNNYKSECVSSGGIIGGGGGVHHQGVVKQPHDMADVLLSLKHAVVHPGQTSGGGGASGAVGSIGACASLSPGAAAVYPQQPQLSYTVHPHQMLMSPSSYTGGFCDQGTMFGANTGGCQGHQSTGSAAMFPSMSVNVSMNMTMHGYPPAYPETLQHQVNCPQMQWGASPQAASPVYQQCQSGGLLSPGYAGGATYSFTADFRSPGAVCETPLITASSSFKPVLTANGGKTASFSPMSGLRPRRQSLSGYPTTPLSSGGKVHTGALSSEDESQRPNLCRICGKTYARPSTLKTHLRTHSGEKPYRCADCNKSFSQAANLTAHVRTHSGEKPFRCPICDRRFSQSSSVTTHMRTHSGERPYRCRMCKKAFSDSSTLTKHLRIHSGEKPYQCKLCLLRFSQSGNLNRHMRVHGSNNPMIG